MSFPLFQKIFYVLCLIMWFLTGTQSENIYVSNKAKKVSHCGTESDPCANINAAIQSAKKNSQITIISTNVPYKECPLYVDKPLSFSGIRGNAAIDCGGKDAFTFSFDNKKEKGQPNIPVKLDVSNLKIQNSKTGFSFLEETKNVNLHLRNIEFVNNDIDVSWSKSPLCYLAMNNVKASGRSGKAIDINGCNKTTLLLSNTKFLGKYFTVISTAKSYFLDIEMDKVVFDMSNRAKTIRVTDSNGREIQRSAMYIVTALAKTAINVKASQFSNHFEEKKSMIYITACREYVKITKKTEKILISRININFNNTIFSNNTVRNGSGGAIVFDLENKLTKKIKHSIIFNASTFVGNSALSGGAVWFSAWAKKVALFNASTFIDNKALGTEDGHGGALFGLGGKFQIQQCKFNGNTATKSGGALYISKEGDVVVKVADSVFRNKRSWSNVEGSIMHLNDVQAFFTGKVVFNLSSSNSGESILLYEGRPTVLRISNSSIFICPQGYNYVEPKYVIKLPKTKKQKNYVPGYQIFAFSCKPCQDLFYSTVRGFKKANETEKRGKCHVCPYGASCNGTIRARANFWGRLEGDEIEMIPCPKGYCCNREPCESYDSCRPHRTGTLCGHCSDGYTESMGSTECLPNEKCNKAWWLWPVANVFGIFVIFCLHQEIINKLVKWSLWTDNDAEEAVEYRRNERNHNERSSDVESNSFSSGSPTETSEPVSTPIQVTPNRPDFTRIEQSDDYNNCGGYIKVFYYFYQAIFLIRLSSYVSSASFPKKMIEFLTPLLNFQFTNLWSCTGENWRPVTKVFVKNSVAYWVYGLSFLAYVLYRFAKKKKGITTDDEPGFQARSFPVRLTGAVMHVILLSYVAQTQFTVQVLNCVQVGDHDVLYIDGSVRCNQSYQNIVWLHFVFSIVSFPFALLFGQNFLSSGRISSKEFIAACFLPSVFLLRWGYKYYKEYKGDKAWPQKQRSSDPFRDKIEYILRYPYKPSQSRNDPSITERCRENWEAVLMFRRLILVVVFIFVKSFLLRAYLFFIVSILFLLAHVFVQPFTNDRVNELDNVSLALIVLIAGLSISEATYNNSGQLIPDDVEMLQILQDWFLALLPLFLVCIFLYPRAKFEYRKWKIKRRGSPVPTEDVVECNLGSVQEEAPNEFSPLTT